MRVVCSKCQKPVAGADIDFAMNRALCRPCGELFAIPVAGDLGSPNLAIDVTYVPADLKLTERSDSNAKRYALSPSRMAAVPLLLFAVVWDSFIITFYTAMAHGKGPAIAFLFPLLHVAAGIFVTWLGLTRLFNTWRLTLDKESFQLTGGPIPVRNAHIAIDAIDRFDAIEARGSRSASWTVRVLTRDQKARKLGLPITQQEHATFVAAKLNLALTELRTPTGYRG